MDAIEKEVVSSSRFLLENYLIPYLEGINDTGLNSEDRAQIKDVLYDLRSAHNILTRLKNRRATT